MGRARASDGGRAGELSPSLALLQDRQRADALYELPGNDEIESQLKRDRQSLRNEIKVRRSGRAAPEVGGGSSDLPPVCLLSRHPSTPEPGPSSGTSSYLWLLLALLISDEAAQVLEVEG